MSADGHVECIGGCGELAHFPKAQHRAGPGECPVSKSVIPKYSELHASDKGRVWSGVVFALMGVVAIVAAPFSPGPRGWRLLVALPISAAIIFPGQILLG